MVRDCVFNLDYAIPQISWCVCVSVECHVVCSVGGGGGGGLRPSHSGNVCVSVISDSEIAHVFYP